MEEQIQWNTIHHIHFVGIKGVAMTALAVWAKERGVRITGSDTAEVFPTDEILETSGISVFEGFSPEHVSGDLIIYTGAHSGRENIEVVEGTKRGIPAFPHGKALGSAMKEKRRLSIAGCHGKTTTSAILATIFMHAKKDPSYTIGSGRIAGLGLPGHAGKGEWFIAEADEYVTEPGRDATPRFLWQHPEILIITNIDYDHPDVYKNLGEVKNAYTSLVSTMTGEKHLILNEDDPESAYLRSNDVQVHRVGFLESAQYRISHVIQKEKESVFHIQQNGILSGPFALRIPGRQNIRNAAQAIVASLLSGLTVEEIQEGLIHFAGAKRRFEYIGSVSGALCFDDYAHHPTEVRTTIKAAKEWYPDKRLIVFFQPHTFSRTEALLSDFSTAFTEADQVYILPVYASARETQGSHDPKILVKEIVKFMPSVVYVDSFDSFAREISRLVTERDIVLFMGAGDIGQKAREIFS